MVKWGTYKGSKAELQPPEVDLYFERKNILCGVAFADTATIFKI